MSKLNCLILDDELPGLTYLRMLCEQFSYVNVVRCFDSSEQFVREVKNIDFDVCLLDINMPGFDGLDVAKQLKNKYIIFVSAHPEFAVDAFELDAIDFIKKPVIKDRLEKALSKAHRLIVEKPTDKDCFNWNTNLGKSIIFFDEIVYVSTSEVDKRDKVAWLLDGKTLLLKNITLDKLMSFLPPANFLQINKSDIVAKKMILAHTANDITIKMQNVLQQQQVVPLGEPYKKSFVEWISQ